MRKLLVIVVLLIGILAGVGELVAPRLVEARVEEQVRARTDGAAAVRADAGSFPFLPRLLLDGRVRSLSVTLEEVTGYEVPFATVTLGLEGIHLDREELLRGEVEVTDVDAGLAVVEIEQAVLAGTLDVAFDLAPDTVEVRGRSLVLAPAGGAAFEVAIPEAFMPCAPELELDDPLVRLSCALEEVPSVLVRAAG